MDDIVSRISSYSTYSDIEIIKLFRQTRDPDYVSIMIYRYDRLILKIISQWRYNHRYSIRLNPSDLKDSLHTAYEAVIYCFLRVSNPSTIKNVGSRIKKYIYNALNRLYKYRVTEFPVDPEYMHYHAQPYTVEHTDTIPYRLLTPEDTLFCYYAYYQNYSNYKLGLLLTSAKTRKYMSTAVPRVRQKTLDRIKLTLHPSL